MILEFPHQHTKLSVQRSPLAKNPPGSEITPWGIFYFIIPKVHLAKTIRKVQLNGLWTVVYGLLAI